MKQLLAGLGLILFCGSIAASAAVPAAREPAPPALPEPVRATLDSGASLWVLERPALPLVHVEISVAWDGQTAPDEDQIAAGLASSLLFAGTRSHPGEALSAEMDRLGATWDAGVSSSRLWMDLDVPVEGLEPGLALLGEVLRESLYPRADGRREARAWAAWREDVWLDIRRLHERALNHAWYPEGHPSRYTASPQEIRAVGAPEVRALVERILREGRAFFAVAGAVDATAMPALFESLFGALTGEGWTTAAPRVEPAASLWLVDRTGFSAAELTVLLPAPTRLDPEEPAAALLMEILAGGFTSRMVEDLRETRGLTYSVYGDYERWEDAGRFLVEVEVPAERTAEAYLAMGEQLDRMAAGGITDEELRKARNALLLRAGRSLQTNAQAAAWLGELMLLRQDVSEEQVRLDTLAQITPAALDALAARWLDAAHRVWVVTGDRDDLEPQFEAAGRVPDRIVGARTMAEEP